jgi:hypothetical protein
MYGSNVSYQEVLKGNQVTPPPARPFVSTVAKYFVIAKNEKNEKSEN